MIGFWAFVEQLSFVLFPLLLLLMMIVGIRHTTNRSRGFSLKGTAALIVLVLLPAVFGWKFIREVQARLFLTSLTSAEVTSFSIGAQQVTDEGKKSVVVQALREIQWFSPHHDGWAEPIELRIKLRSGEEKYFRVATYLREPGAVIDFADSRGQGGLHAG